MKNHNDKRRDMARSVLPSTARKAAADRRRIAHKRERAKARDHNREAEKSHDENMNTLARATRMRNRDIAELVEERRSADKTGPLVRWAERLVATDPHLSAAPHEERRIHFRGALPNGVIGDHALSHLGRLVIDPYQYRVRWEGSPRRADNRQELVRRVLADGRHGELNDALKVIDVIDYVDGRIVRSRVRLLGGFHDIDAFVDALTYDTGQILRDIANNVRHARH
jgi:hypothetical protein